MLKRPLTGLLAVIAFSVAHAQSIKPGLWDITQKMGGNPQMDAAMAQMQQQMAAMPPEQRKQMEAMMAQRGVNMPSAASGGGMGMKVCITPEMAARSEMPSQKEGDCTTNITSRTASGMKMSFVCTNPPSKGDGTYTFSGDTAYTMAMTIQSTQDGKTQNMTLNGSGKWLGTDCGNIKPMAPHKAPRQ